ncbi:hypothetical protein SAY87_014974 [Trapa incisa]|uniref:Peptidase A1 domain-containing protein n=1 Tax=Trapa incisa TaxID=236973 RepID=A0AAN7JM08_9MYRT|nr:hypothetical protein SAY87_014974 [Trapa incisa]
MAQSSRENVLFLLLLTFSATASLAQQSFRPKALVMAVTKDASTLQYVTRISQRTPLVPLNLVVDLGGQFMWVDCEDRTYVSSTYRSAPCRSAQCSLARASGCGSCLESPARPGCNNNTCFLLPDNSVTHTATSGELASDVLSLSSTDGSTPGRAATVPSFLFSCAGTFLLDGLTGGAKGMAGLGRTRIALPSQLAAAFSFRQKFAVCLSSSTSSRGVIFFGDGPYNLLPDVDASASLIYTPLFINPVSTAAAYSQGEPSSEYFIGVKAITVGSQAVTLNKTLLVIDKKGNGGTKISTVNPYTILERSIFTAVTAAFISESAARNITRVAAVVPFEVCFSSENMGITRVGPSVPFINLMLQNKDTFWTITGSNSMVQVSDNVMCLGFLDGGESPTTSIVIGGYQLEDNLLKFDLAASRVGFSSSLLWKRTTCANFNFTSSS